MTTEIFFPKLSELQLMIQGTLDAYQGEPMRAERLRALKAIQWRLRGPHGEFVGVNGFFGVAFVPENDALIFDGRDNEARKLAMYEAILGQLTIEILPQKK
jgi:hypothetical protein